MIDATILELMHKDIDDGLKAGEKSRLVRYLAENEEANNLYQELQALSNNLDQIPQVEAPADLKSSIMSQINPDLYRNPEINASKIFNFGKMFTQQSVRTILAYAALLIIGFGISALLIKSPIPSEHDDFYKIIGMMGIEDAPEVDRVQSISVQLDELKGVVEMKEADSIVWVEFNLESKTEFNAQVFYEPECLTFILFRPIHPDKLTLKHTENQLDVKSIKPFTLSFIKNSEIESYLRFSIQQDDQKSKNFEFSISKSAEQRVQ